MIRPLTRFLFKCFFFFWLDRCEMKKKTVSVKCLQILALLNACNFYRDWWISANDVTDPKPEIMPVELHNSGFNGSTVHFATVCTGNGNRETRITDGSRQIKTKGASVRIRKTIPKNECKTNRIYSQLSDSRSNCWMNRAGNNMYIHNTETMSA